MVEREHGARGRGARRGELADVGGGDWVLLEQGIAEGLHEVGDQASLLVGGELVQREVEELRELEQEAGGQGAAVVLDQIEIAGGDAEPLGELRLAQPFATLQRAAN